MGVNKILTTIAGNLIGLGLGTGLGLAIIGGINLYHGYNVIYEEGDKNVFKKVDGIFSSTELIIYKDSSVEINRFSPLNTRFYTDRDGNQEVDRISLGFNPLVRGSHPQTFYRDEHFKQYSDVFKRADQDFREQIKRFKHI